MIGICKLFWKSLIFTFIKLSNYKDRSGNKQKSYICAKSLEIKKNLFIYGYPKRILIFSRGRNTPLKKEYGFIPTVGEGKYMWRNKSVKYIYLYLNVLSLSIRDFCQFVPDVFLILIVHLSVNKKDLLLPTLWFRTSSHATGNKKQNVSKQNIFYLIYFLD